MTPTARCRVYLFTHRRHELLPRALDSLRAQTFRDWVCEVHNDAPGDAFPGELVARINDPRVRLVDHAHNLGPTQSFNLAFEPVAEPYVALLEDDNWWDSDFLATMIDVLDERTDAEIAFTNMRVWEEHPDGRWIDTGRFTGEHIETPDQQSMVHELDFGHTAQATGALHSQGAMMIRTRDVGRHRLPPTATSAAMEPIRERTFRHPLLFVSRPLANFARTRETSRSSDAAEWMHVQVMLVATFFKHVPPCGQRLAELWTAARAAKGRFTGTLLIAAACEPACRGLLRGATVGDYAHLCASMLRHPVAYARVVNRLRSARELWTFVDDATAERRNEQRGDVTLQISLSAGDLAYCERTVPALIATHRRAVRDVVITVDCCIPQTTPLVHAASRFESGDFARRIARSREICEGWRREGLVDRVDFLEPHPDEIAALNAKYCGIGTAASHDHLGHAFSAYFFGWEQARTRYVLHFDADILLHQAAGANWVNDAVSVLRNNARTLAVSPRIAPPLRNADAMVTVDAPGSGWGPSWSLDPAPAGWRSDWMSTRCHVVDRDRLLAMLPLMSRKRRYSNAWRRVVTALASPVFATRIWRALYENSQSRHLLPRAVRWLAHRGLPEFPLPPEVLIQQRAREAGMTMMYLRDERVWFIHPDTKPPEFLELLPSLLDAVADGEYPDEQRGVSGVRVHAWAAREAAAQV